MRNDPACAFFATCILAAGFCVGLFCLTVTAAQTGYEQLRARAFSLSPEDGLRLLESRADDFPGDGVGSDVARLERALFAYATEAGSELPAMILACPDISSGNICLKSPGARHDDFHFIDCLIDYQSPPLAAGTVLTFRAREGFRLERLLFNGKALAFLATGEGWRAVLPEAAGGMPSGSVSGRKPRLIAVFRGKSMWGDWRKAGWFY